MELKLPCLPIELLWGHIASALEDLAHFRSQECAKRIEGLLLHELPEEAAKMLLEIQGQLKLFEDDNAEGLLSQMLGALEKEED